ncbi:MAG TPA: hypothetical protein VEW95_11490 [Candidatus Limnocylindrales bacterium]|nr:hypothetical protein [Candidatus Limnocylindrales bacterium]
MTPPAPGRVLGIALLAWGLGHLAIGRRRIGFGLLAAELLSALLVAWLTIGLVDTSAYLVPFIAGVAFIVAWTWQAVDAYRSAHRLQPARPPTPERSPAAAIGWVSLPLLVWGTGFWLIGAHAATPASVLDRFVTEWSAGELDSDWPAGVREEASVAGERLGSGPDPFNGLRVNIVSEAGRRATAVADAIHYERRASRFLWIFPGSELVPVADERVLTFELEAMPVELPGGGDVGAVRWELVAADAGS